ncbi:phage tail protein [Maritimibacter dapengensis]|uniref:Glycoside hydrolase TIM-barrel-like domain-containing protein n=1 Tax=Maritimibacter dapengensis TaxID=2836868 RepID=A0ABS6SZC8_9RHOB|nr:phage tail protein [Maritimibacter dapengensis]MBV7378343.1 glycoside hydrolase TIM-barrel-like domain-containing protein [Maritimibacter dapengensis]
MARSIPNRRGRRSNAAWLASAAPRIKADFLDQLSASELQALPFLFEFWALDHQVPPGGPWRSWVILGGRGAGKTRAGAEWVRSEVEGHTPRSAGKSRRVALIGETFEQVRAVMIFGESGILACSPPDRRPVWEATRRQLVWPNGAVAQAFSASEPEALRGPQFDAAWADEIGCAAIDKGTNEPNKFVDPKSSESALPRFSNGRCDDFMQAQYLRALREYWEDPDNNPVDPQTGVQMVDMARAHVWAWDARPYPWFPNRRGLWGDWPNYERGHWLNGRASMRSLESVVSEICHRSGVTAIDTTRLYGSLRGYTVGDVTDARAALQPLMTAYGFEAAERDGVVAFFTRSGKPGAELEPERFAVSDEVEGDLQLTRAPEADLAGRVRLSFAEEGGDYGARATEAVFADEETHGVSVSELPLVLTSSEAQAIAERWLAQSRVSQDRARFALAPSDMSCRAGDVVRIGTETGAADFRIDRVEHAGMQIVQAVRVEPGVFEAGEAGDRPPRLSGFTPSVPVTAIWLDLPLLTGDEVEHAPHLAVVADPWPGDVSVFSSATDNGYRLNRVIRRPALFGVTENAMPKASPGLIDCGPALRVRMPRGALSSSGETAMLNGSNVAAIGLGGPDGWEIFQFAEAVLVEEGVYELSGRLRGQAGSDPFIPETWDAGAMVVFLDRAVRQIGLPRSARGFERHYRIGPASEPLDDESHVHEIVATNGVGLRPYRPVHLASAWNAGDLSVRWIRRSRIDGDSWQGFEVPIGHGGEQYSVRVVHDGTVVREATVTAPIWTYTAGMQAADEVTRPFKVDVAQVSQSFGPGPAARIEIN